MGGIVPSMMEQVARFHREVTGRPMPETPTMLAGERRKFAATHLYEEVDEFQTARTIEEQADALIDTVYVAMGALLEMGLAPGPLFDEVHRANMERRPGKNSRRGDAQFDAVKPDGWTGPQLQIYCTVTRAEMDWLLDQRIQAAKEQDAYSRTFSEMPTLHFTPVGVSEGKRAPLVADKELWGADDKKPVARTYRSPRILVLGHARNGKDTVAEILRDRYGMRFTSSSLFCAERYVLPYMRARGHIYDTAEECFADRANHRKEWYDCISAVADKDPTTLTREIFGANDVYCGMRASRDFHAAKAAGLFDLCLWVDASGLGIPPEPRDSCTVEPWMADLVVDNSGTLEELKANVDRVMARFA